MQIPKWVPEAASRRLAELMLDPSLRADDRELLERLAIYDAMKTDVWERLPSDPAGVENEIIDWAYYSVTSFSSLIPTPLQLGKPPKKGDLKKPKGDLKKWAKIIQERPAGTATDTAVGLAVQLAQAMLERKNEYAFYWPQCWQGDKSITLAQSIEFVCSLGLFLDRVNKAQQAIVAALPPIKRPYSAKTPEIFFTNIMSSRLKVLYGRKLDGVVSALVDVVFNKEEGTAQEKIRGRRRGADRKKVAKN